MGERYKQERNERGERVSGSPSCILPPLPPSVVRPFLIALGAGYTVEIGPLSAALSASIYRICELIKPAARWHIMKKI